MNSKNDAIDGVIQLISANIELMHQVYREDVTDLEHDGKKIPAIEDMKRFKKELSEILRK